MSTYKDYSYLSAVYLTDSEMSKANTLTFEEYTPTIESTWITWDKNAYYSTSQDYAILNDLFVFSAVEGATYDVFSHSFFDPHILMAYDDKGVIIATDDGSSSYGTDHLEFVADRTGLFYISASWNQGSYHDRVSISVYEDVDTVSTSTIEPEESFPYEDIVSEFDQSTFSRDFLNPALSQLDATGLTTTHLLFDSPAASEGYSVQVDSDIFSTPTDLYTVILQKGESYDFLVMSLSEPGMTILYDPSGNPVVLNNELDDINSSLKTDIITDYTATSSGQYTLYTETTDSALIRIQIYELSSYERTEDYLHSLGIQTQEAKDFIIGNIDAPELIFNVADAYNITNQMLADIVGVETSTVQGFWTGLGLDHSLLG